MDENKLPSGRSVVAPLVALETLSQRERLLQHVVSPPGQRGEAVEGAPARSEQQEERAAGMRPLVRAPGALGPVERDREAEFICDAANRLRLHADALCLAVGIFDRVATLKRVPAKYANCLAVASLYIAKKLCEDGDESPSLFLESLHAEYSNNELKRMELAVLGILGWDALLPTAERFATVQLTLLGFGWGCRMLRAPLESCLRRGSICRNFSPSLLGLSLVSLLLEQYTPQWPALTNLLLSACSLSLSSLIRCREAILSSCPQGDALNANPFSPLLADDTPSASGNQYEGVDVMPTVESPLEELTSPRALKAQC